MKYWLGVPTFAPSGLRTHICQVPSTAATRNATNATQKWARQSLSVLRTGNPPVRSRLELIVRQDLYCGPHLAMTEPAIFVAGHQEVACPRKFSVHLCHIPGHDHRIDVRSGNKK